MPDTNRAAPQTEALSDPAVKWAVSYVQYYRPLNLRPTFWPGMSPERSVGLDHALELGIVEHVKYANGDSRWDITKSGRAAISSALRAVAS